MLLLECVPNVSEGRCTEVIERLTAALSGAPGICLADVSSDVDHNRTVFTLLGDAAALVDAVERLYALAVEGIDLATHEGVHPRLGVVDVAPFVPLRGATMEDAVAAARDLGSRLGREHAATVFLYGHAATRGDLRHPAVPRSLGLAGLADAIQEGTWRPDFGEPRIDPSRGVVLVGAREPLIAFNATLATADVAVARRIARRVRQSSGGLDGVQALGFYLASRRRAQVSTNIIDTAATSMYALLQEIRSLAAAEGTAVDDTEIVGLVPSAAVDLALRDGLQLAALGAGKRIEDHL